ncbi:hypothetical protein WJ972_13290 [Achromobacter insuavis]
MVTGCGRSAGGGASMMSPDSTPASASSRRASPVPDSTRAWRTTPLRPIHSCSEAR